MILLGIGLVISLSFCFVVYKSEPFVNLIFYKYEPMIFHFEFKVRKKLERLWEKLV